MKVILKQDVYKHGVAGEVVNVADGYARNYLIPQGLAVKATQGNMKQAEKLRREAAARRARVHNELKGIAEQLEGLELTFAVKAGQSGKLYGSVTMAEIADMIGERLGIEIDRRRVGEQHSLRELGEHFVPVRLASDLHPRVRVIIYREGETPEAALAEAEALAEEEAMAEEAALAEEQAEALAEEEVESPAADEAVEPPAVEAAEA